MTSSMRNRANHLLAALALADMAVFLCMLPSCLASFSIFYQSVQFRIWFATWKTFFAAVANWFSCSAIWIVLAVSIERLLIIWKPFRSLEQYRARNTAAVIFLILITSSVLTSYHHFSHKCFLLWFCNMTQVHAQCLPTTTRNWKRYGVNEENNPSLSFILYIRISAYANPLLAVILPIATTAILNASLICLLRIRKTRMHDMLARSVGYASLKSAVRSHEQKMTITVVAIVTCFSVTQSPSAILFLYAIFNNTATNSTLFYSVSSVTNFLVLTGKMLNVFLFCLSSTTFRRKFFFTLRKWISCLCSSQPARLAGDTLLETSLCSAQKASVPRKFSIRIGPACRRSSTMHNNPITKNHKAAMFSRSVTFSSDHP
ncbi:hypothetical protein AB6A40_007461 [Gnathostoma spinigerum]|uniref:G-protein coupled receptors family 1 profile domain-containing protein n=1 Tax=Gnathostoma spinigerum TaxID=75299 RepID=A0ABD6EW04_9BILA